MVTEVILKGRVKRVKNIRLKTHTPISELKVPARVQLDANGVPKNYKRIVDGTATAYYGGGGTASGRRAMPGHIAVNPKRSLTEPSSISSRLTASSSTATA